MSQGGNRPGSGRPLGSKSQKTLEQDALRQYIFDEVVKNKKNIVLSLIKCANKGNVQAIKELFDRSVGRVKEIIDLTSPNDEDVGLTDEEKDELRKLFE